MCRLFDSGDIKHKRIYLAVILLSCVVLFSSCSGDGYKRMVAKTLRNNQGVFDHIAEYMLLQYETTGGKGLNIRGEDFLNGDKSIIMDSALHEHIHGLDDPNGLDNLCCIPVKDELLLDDIQYLFESLGYVNVYLLESNWKNDVMIVFTKIPRTGRWEEYSYHTADFPPEGKDGHSFDAWYDKTTNGLEYVGGALYLGDSWYYRYGDLEGYGKYAG